MKRFTLLLLIAFFGCTLTVLAQDDMYFTPKKETKEEKARRKAEEAARRRAQEEAERRAQEEMMVRVYNRIYHEDVDLYNRHYPASSTYTDDETLVFDSLNGGNDLIMFRESDTLYNRSDNYKFTRMMQRFDDLDYALCAYNNSFYPWYDPVWYDPWYYDSWYYSPRSWYWGWNRPYHYYGYWGYSSAWYDPWYHGWGWGGYYRPYYVHVGRPVTGWRYRGVSGTRNHGGAYNSRIGTSTRTINRNANTNRSNSPNRSYIPSNTRSNSSMNRGSSSNGSYGGDNSRGGGGGSRGGGGGTRGGRR